MEEPSSGKQNPESEGTPASGARRILVIANETVGGQALRQAIESSASGHRAEILVVCPALNSRLRHWASDVDRAKAAAEKRLEGSLSTLASLGLQAEGRVGDADPVQAVEDALRIFPADQIIVSTHPRGRSNWLEKRVVERARERFALPIDHVVVDLDREQARAPDQAAEAAT